MQVYRGMDIGTAKPSPAFCAKLPHHLINIRNPDEAFTVGDFTRLADEACAAIAARGALPVVSGGTGFYLKNFILGMSEAPPSNPALRLELKQELAEKGAEVLMAELAGRDPVSAARIHLNDTYRLLRALEVCRQSGLPLSSFAVHPAPLSARPCYRFLIVELYWPREELYRRIDRRCEAMFRAGLADEAAALYHKGYTPDDPGLRAIGYREFFIRDDEGRWRFSSDTEGVKALVARNSRRYAKRQLTFFSSIPGLIRLDCMRRVHTPPPWGDIKGMYPEALCLTKTTIPRRTAGSNSAAGLVDCGETVPVETRLLDLLSGLVHTKATL
jgi:tRNA dimethylallyltransferase